MLPIIQSTHAALAEMFQRKAPKPFTRAQEESLARQWGRLNFHSVVRYVPSAPVFVHCHECGWPVNAGRTNMLLGNEQRTPATEEQMQWICEGVRRHMEIA